MSEYENHEKGHSFLTKGRTTVKIELNVWFGIRNRRNKTVRKLLSYTANKQTHPQQTNLSISKRRILLTLIQLQKIKNRVKVIPDTCCTVNGVR